MRTVLIELKRAILILGFFLALAWFLIAKQQFQVSEIRADIKRISEIQQRTNKISGKSPVQKVE